VGYIRVAESALPLVLVTDKALEVLTDVAELGQLRVRGKYEDVGRCLAGLDKVECLLVVRDIPLSRPIIFRSASRGATL